MKQKFNITDAVQVGLDGRMYLVTDVDKYQRKLSVISGSVPKSVSFDDITGHWKKKFNQIKDTQSIIDSALYSYKLCDWSHEMQSDSAGDIEREMTRIVDHCIAYPDSSASRFHGTWVRQKAMSGWTYGPNESLGKRTHPLLVEFEDLPSIEKLSRLFKWEIATKAIRDRLG